MLTRLMLGVIVAGVVVALLLLGRGAEAEPDCVLYAQFVEKFEALDPEDRRGSLAEWLAYSQGSESAQREIRRAMNYVIAGGKSASAWESCSCSSEAI